MIQELVRARIPLYLQEYLGSLILFLPLPYTYRVSLSDQLTFHLRNLVLKHKLSGHLNLKSEELIVWRTVHDPLV